MSSFSNAMELSVQEDPIPSGSAKARAIVLTRDRASRQWAPRWLEHMDLDVVMLDSVESLTSQLSVATSTIVIVDASMLASITKTLGLHSVSILVMCNTPREVQQIISTGVTDVVRRPFEWQIIAERASRIVRESQMQKKLNEVSAELSRMRQVSKEIKAASLKSENEDALTGLPDREGFLSILRRTVTFARKGPELDQLVVMVIGLDRFRVVNKEIGHQHGNTLLIEFASRLRKCLQDANIIGRGSEGTISAAAARLSGVRFALMLSTSEMANLSSVQAAIAEELSQPFEVAGQSIYLSSTCGAAVFPKDHLEPGGLIQCAENAMLEARSMGASFRCFDQAASDNSSVLELDQMLRDAIRNDELSLVYQPIFDTQSRRVVATEALLRWHHPVQGLIPPTQFVPLAEQSGLMVTIGNSVIRKACGQLRSWLDAGISPLRMAVNVSLCQLVSGNLVEVVAEALADNQLDANLLEIELSERGVVNQHEDIVAAVNLLKSTGVRISIDDFGTGNAAISYLRDLPVDTIKIDRSYISGPSATPRATAIASGMVVMARELNAQIIAEGVESDTQMTRVADWNCDESQGFLLAKPMSADEVLNLVTSSSQSAPANADFGKPVTFPYGENLNN